MANVPLPAPLVLLGVPIHPVSARELVDILVRRGAGPRLRRVYNVNVHAMNLACEDDTFRRWLGKADLVFCDGYGVKWGTRLAGLTIPHRMTPPDWIDDFAARAAAADQSVFALGDEPEVAASFQAKLAEARPGYRVAGSHDGFFEKQRAANDAVVDLINASGATHLLVVSACRSRSNGSPPMRTGSGSRRLSRSARCSAGARASTGAPRDGSRITVSSGSEPGQC
jgi:N-acetylglucosaminyldiphosphoundecaprenol N-acetyl-beta-D-mannosaminyltransferase